MIKNLKRRFIIIYMVTLICFLFTILTLIYLMVYRSEINQSQQIIEMALENNTKRDEPMSSPPKKTIDFSTDSLSMTNMYEGHIEGEESPRNFQGGNVQGGEGALSPDFHQNNDFFDGDFTTDYHPDDYSNYEVEHERPYEYGYDAISPYYDTTLLPDVTTASTPSEVVTSIPKDPNPNDPDSVEDDTNPPETTVTYASSEDVQELQVEKVKDILETTTVTEPIHTTTAISTDTTTDTMETPPVDETTISDVTPNDDESIVTEIETTTSTTTSTSSGKNGSNSSSKIPTLKDDTKESIVEYEGNLARNTIYVSTNEDGEIETISYQYFESSDNISLEQTISSIISSEVMNGKVEIDDVKFRYNVFKKEDGNGYDIVFLDRAIEISTLRRLLIIFIGISIIGIILLFGLSWMLASWTTVPIANAWEKQKQFIADASHELKTPLTVIAANTDVILSNQDDTVKNQSKWLTYIKSETVRMSKLVSDLLYIAKSDVNEVNMIMNEFNISHTISGICLVFETIAFENGKILNYDITDNISYVGDEDRIRQLVNILVDNSIKHSGANAKITILLKRDIIKDKIKLIVTNTNGEDIPKGMEDRLFERFFRVDKARNHNNGNHGLGLNIALSIVKNHNGTITVNSTPEHVVTFTVTL